VIELDGHKRHLHADRLKTYNAQINELTVRERDVVFGELGVMPENEIIPQSASHLSPPGEHLDPSELSHLTVEQRAELLNLLDKFPHEFSDIPGLCSLVMHEIHVTYDFRSTRFQAYYIGCQNI